MLVPRPRLWLALAALAAAAVGLAAALASLSATPPATAASHREAPLISMDPGADITDFFMFRSYEPGKSDRVVLLMDVMSEEPSSGPNYWNFDPNVVYSINVDSDRDGKADDVRFDFRFKTELRGLTTQLGLPLSYVGGGPLPVIDDLDDAGIGLRQTYSVTMTAKGQRPVTLAENRIAVPSNVGPRTMPNYDALAAQGVYTLDGGIRVFAGQRDDPFFIDLGAVFDTLNLRTFSGPPPSRGIDMLSGFNVHTIALEVPIGMLAPGTNKVIGAYASTSRSRITVRLDDQRDLGRQVQVQRLANPLVNEVIIGTQDKDRWNATEPEDESRFLGYYLKPRFAAALQLVFGVNTGCLVPLPDCRPNPPAAGTLPSLPEFNRTDLQALLLQYNPIVYGNGQGGRISDLLRLDLNVAPTPLGQQSSVPGALGGDKAAWPNGRRPNDDVTDIAVKAVGGANYLALPTIDGISVNDRPTTASFPFLATPHDGRNRVHANP
jgi:Domain of unknown function (DUF4331)